MYNDRIDIIVLSRGGDYEILTDKDGLLPVIEGSKARFSKISTDISKIKFILGIDDWEIIVSSGVMIFKNRVYNVYEIIGRNIHFGNGKYGYYNIYDILNNVYRTEQPKNVGPTIALALNLFKFENKFYVK